MRILLVSPGNNRKYGGGFYYAFHRKLMNGFIRNGHFVYQYSDRDTADYAMGLRRLGARLANKRLIEIAAELKPSLLVLLQSHMVTPQMVRIIRKVAPGVKTAAISIDDISDATPAGQFRHLLQEADFGFATTGGRTLEGFAQKRPMAFIPNPVDLSIDAQTAFDAKTHKYDLIFAGQQPRERIVEFLAASDAVLVHLRKAELFEHVIPSKIFEIMACGKPVIMGVAGEAAGIIRRAGSGVTIEPENVDEFLHAA